MKASEILAEVLKQNQQATEPAQITQVNNTVSCDLPITEDDILSTGCLVRFSCPIPENTKEDAATTKELVKTGKVSAEAGNWRKYKYPPEMHKAMSTVLGAIRTWHYDQTIDWNEPGKQFLTAVNQKAYLEGMRERKEQYKAARDAFIARLPEARQWALAKHNGSFEADLYDERKVRAKFTFEIDVDPIPSSNHYVGQMRELLGADIKAIDARVKSNLEKAEASLFDRFETPLRKLVDLCTKKDTTDPKDPSKTTRTRITDALIENIIAICDLIPALNVKKNPKLANIAIEAKAAFQGQYTTEDLQENTDKRKAAIEAANAILAKMRR